MVRKLGPIAIVVVAGFGLAFLPITSADEGCNTPGNLTVNCNFDNFVDRTEGDSIRKVPDGWFPWVLMGNPAFDIDDHGSAPGAPAQRIWSDGGTWTAGLYQQVSVTQGRGYRAKIDWAPLGAPSIERKLGIDPLGGTDPASSSVVWGPPTWDEIEKMPDLAVSTLALAPTITVFVWTHHNVSYGQDEVFLDAVTLVEDPSVVPPATQTPTAIPTKTRRPATRTPVPAPPTDTPTAEPTEPSPTETPTLVPTSTPIPPSATPTSTTTPSATAAPTVTPTTLAVTSTPISISQLSSTATARPTERAESDSGNRGAMLAVAFLFIAGGAALAALVLGVLFLWLWLRNRGS